MTEPAYSDQGATFGGPGDTYRYQLWRAWDASLPRVAFVMLNPSTADAAKLDPTLRRCLGFARAWGCGAFEIANLYGLRSTDPAGLWKVTDPVGPWNDAAIEAVAKAATFGVVAAWGAHAELTRAEHVLSMLLRHRAVYHLGLTAGGRPMHPLYRPGALMPTLWRCAHEIARAGVEGLLEFEACVRCGAIPSARGGAA